jgi:hypothetical protein
MQELSGDGENGEKETDMQRRPWKSLVVLTAGLALVALARFSHADEHGRASGKQHSRGDVERIINRVETNNDQFTKAFDKALDRSKLDGTSREDQLNNQVRQLDQALDRLRTELNRGDNRGETRSNVQQVMRQAEGIDRLMRNTRMAGGVEEKWTDVRKDLNTLAGMYDLKTLGGRNTEQTPRVK